MVSGVGGKKSDVGDSLEKLNRQDWLSVGFRRKLDFGSSLCGCDSVIEMEQAGRRAGKHEVPCCGQATPEMNITCPRRYKEMTV